MLALIAIIIALASLGVAGLLALRLATIESRLPGLSASRPISADVASALPESGETPRPLEGLRIAISIRQDHPQPQFASILKEQLLLEDAIAEIVDDPTAEGYDLRINGSVECNGYAEIYYSADLTCASARQQILSMIEKPAHGDRPSNLALEFVNRLKKELDKLVRRQERGDALRELLGP